MDESLMSLKMPLTKCWMKRGVQKRISMFTGQGKYQMLAGALNWHTGHIFVKELTHLNSEAVIGYFEWLLTEVYPTQTVVLVMDNASFHHSKSVQAALSCFDDRVLVVWLPTYSPDMNPIERFWKHLKSNCSNYLYESLQDMLDHIHYLIACQNTNGHHLQLSFLKN